MARIKLSEFRAKNILSSALGFDYQGIEIDAEDNIGEQLANLGDGSYAVKVDQATKKRNQLGLVRLNRTKPEVESDIDDFSDKGFRFMLVEPMVPHEKTSEHFLAIMRTENGIDVQYSSSGGVDIESNQDSLIHLSVGMGQEIQSVGEVSAEQLSVLLDVFNNTNMTYLEMNPLLVDGGRLLPLDAAAEVDSTAELSVQGIWTLDDARSSTLKKTDSEKTVEDLQATSMAALTLRVINPDGSVLLLLSGGGASLVVADEFNTHGLANELIDYGEYSGNPNEDELFGYTEAALKLLQDSKSNKKIIVIAGGVANFTDIAATFKGIIRAFTKNQEYLQNNNVSVYVRRGGPNQEKGLKLMEEFLSSLGLKHSVNGPDVSLGELVKRVAEELRT